MNDFDAQNNPYLAPKAPIANIDTASGETELAGRLTRLGAALIDGLIQGTVILLLLSPLIVDRGFDWIVLFIEENELLTSVLSLILGLAAYTAVNFYLLRKNGQTVGKRALGIKIVRTDGSPVSVQRLVLNRYLSMPAISIIPVVGGIIAGFVNPLLIFRDSRKCLHDDIADTIVIKA